MKKNHLGCLTLLLLLLFLTGCQTDDENLVPQSLRVNDFVWKGMNLYYLWQQDVTNLDDDRFANQQELNDFLYANPNPIELFQDLRTAPEIDRFSVIFSDYRILEGILAGTTKNNGMEYGIRRVPGSTTEVFGYVRYILPNSDASSNNIKRGDIFYAINNQPLTTGNYQQLLANETYTLQLADYNNGTITPNGQSVALTKAVYSENPVLITKVFDLGDKKIGYLMYNGFFPAYDNALNHAFGELKAQQITHLVLDLRYNSGGSIATATKLASMITGQFPGQLFAREQWNDKMQSYYESTNPANLENRFVSTLGSVSINQLGLGTLYVLTTGSTASASELVINGLSPYINIVQIGENTTGKNVGSVTLYDSPSFGKKDRNPKHYFAMQPIVLKVVNRDGFGDYQANGLEPDFQLSENLNDLGILGDESELFLSAAINHINGSGRILQPQLISTEPVSDSKSIMQIQNQMYSDIDQKLTER